MKDVVNSSISPSVLSEICININIRNIVAQIDHTVKRTRTPQRQAKPKTWTHMKTETLIFDLFESV